MRYLNHVRDMANKILEGPPFKSSVPKKTVGQLFFEKAEKYGDKIFQVDGTSDSSETYASVRLRSTRVAIELERRGVTSKHVVSICTRNSLDAVIPIFATLYLGAKVASFEPSFSLEQTQHLMSLVSPKVIFVEEASVGLIENSLKETQIKSDIIVFGRWDNYPTFADLSGKQKNEETFKPLEVDLNAVAFIFFSSGTTGLSKAIPHTHNSYVHFACGMRDFNMGGVVLHLSTFYWMSTHMLMLTAIMTGGSMVFFHSFDSKAILDVMEKYKVNGIFATSFLLNKLLNFTEAKSFDTSSLTKVLTGGSSFNPQLIEISTEIFPTANILNMYGLSENGLTTSFLSECHQELIQKKTFSCGKPFYGNRLKIVDDDGRILGSNQQGEICVSSPCLFRGYYNVNSCDYFDNDGFFKTGDRGYYDEDGCVYHVGRIVDVFHYQGWQIVPAEIEVVLLGHSFVEEAVVFGVPWSNDGEAPAACIVLKDGATIAEEEIMNFVAEKVSDPMKLRGGVMFVKSLAKTPTGKVMKRAVKNYFIENSYKKQ